MPSSVVVAPKEAGLRALPRNVWAVSLTSFFMDASGETSC